MSFDPVQDSIMANNALNSQSPPAAPPPPPPRIHNFQTTPTHSSTQSHSHSPVQVHANPITAILNPTNTPEPINNKSLAAKQKRSRDGRKRKYLYKQGSSIDNNNSNSSSSNTQKSDRERESKSYQTLLINSRTRHLKKNDGEPYWRNEIQFEFLLRLLFNRDRVFTNPYYESKEFSWPEYFKTYKDENGELHENDGEKLTFFELYLVTLLKSPKISRILNERLTCDLVYSLNFIIISLLVNIGRLNTTVNFDHEMKSQFRTYHSIPALQVGDHTEIIKKYYEPSNIPKHLKDDEFIIRGGEGYTMKAVKNLQDTPRIKSILKSINDLNSEIPKNFKEFVTGSSADATKRYDLNVISLIFLLCVHEFDLHNIFFADDNAKELVFNNSFSVGPDTNSSNLANNVSGSPNGSTIRLRDETPKDDDEQSGSLFNEIWLNTQLKPVDKVKRFLWLIYLFKETDFKLNNILQNPFNNLETRESIK
ncbi:unnamed protein product [Ambrosiozyma monospora]|uniref:Unnamed protein product n=1 Tax=Ambrosiozyma monospora TaxID=43982 RepID=A0ACB5SVW5_AMBMO|nr:unnamed protein product [Ambrosiozyma monospora]